MDSLGAQHAPDLMFGYIPQGLRQQPSAPGPMSCWRRLIQFVQHAATGVFIVAGHRSRPRSILEPGQPSLGKTHTPLADGCRAVSAACVRSQSCFDHLPRPEPCELAPPDAFPSYPREPSSPAWIGLLALK